MIQTADFAPPLIFSKARSDATSNDHGLMPSALALSPHLDDAVFSCGGTLAVLAQAGWQVTVCTAFTRSIACPTGFALACQLDKSLSPEVDYMAIRRGEDAVACERLGVASQWLDLPEAPHRGYEDARALFASPRDDDLVTVPLSHRLADLLKAPPTVLLAPQALGGHVDHVVLIHALRSILHDNASVLWWTDFPYSQRADSHPSRPFDKEMGSLPAIAISGDAGARLDACAAYVTQLGFQFSGLAGLACALQEAGPIEHMRAQGEVIKNKSLIPGSCLLAPAQSNGSPT